MGVGVVVTLVGKEANVMALRTCDQDGSGLVGISRLDEVLRVVRILLADMLILAVRHSIAHADNGVRELALADTGRPSLNQGHELLVGRVDHDHLRTISVNLGDCSVAGAQLIPQRRHGSHRSSPNAVGCGRLIFPTQSAFSAAPASCAARR